jgi:CheY-like chemotaxis protein
MPRTRTVILRTRGNRHRKPCGVAQNPRVPGVSLVILREFTVGRLFALSGPMPFPPTNRPRRVLLVDGDSRTSQRLAELLAQDGYEVDIARDGAEALARLALTPALDTLITELTLRVGDGVSLARSARLRMPGLRVVVVTRHVNSVVPARFGQPPPVVLSKPLDYEGLLAVLASPSPSEDMREARPASPRI